MRTLLAAGLLVALALSGCSGADATYTCTAGPGAGRTVELATVPGSDADGFDPESACPQPVAPSLVVVSLPKDFTAYAAQNVAWRVLNGTYAGAHSMLNELRLSPTAVPDAELTQDNFNAKYPVQKLQFQHQDVPQLFTGKLRFDAPGMWHARVFAQVQGNGLPGKEYWSPETMIMVLAAQPTGQTTTLELPQAFPLQKGPATASLALGDGISVKNSGAAPATVQFKSVPAGFTAPAQAEVASGASSTPVPLTVPGSYTLHVFAGSDADATAQDIAISVAEPA